MAIISSTEVKALLGIGTTDYDTQIAALIPQVQQYIINYCKNDFRVNEVYVEGSNIAFVEGGASADTITDDDSQLDEFSAGDHIVIEGAYRNNGRIYQINTVAAGTLTLVTTDDVEAEDMGGEESVRLTLVVFPPDLKAIAADLIAYHLNKSFTVGTKDSGGAVEPVESYPVDYERDFQGVLNRLSKYRKVYR